MLLALAACAPEPEATSRIVLREFARVPGEPPILRVRLGLEPSPPIRAALEHGIPLTIEWSLEPARGQRLVRRLRLQRSPLLRRYVLEEEGQSGGRSFQHLNALLAAVEQQEFVLGPAEESPLGLRVRLVREALPPPLQLPALLDPEWRLAARFLLPGARSSR
ncbi:MAG: hypothetical protein KatS3mg125_0336 [Lysobacterales bacterium]|jgi:hypothetical protein|nr:MAG: hypothetical protein KatS3mg125_0336 [Xanthomonadales bacterium]